MRAHRFSNPSALFLLSRQPPTGNGEGAVTFRYIREAVALRLGDKAVNVVLVASGETGEIEAVPCNEM